MKQKIEKLQNKTKNDNRSACETRRKIIEINDTSLEEKASFSYLTSSRKTNLQKDQTDIEIRKTNKQRIFSRVAVVMVMIKGACVCLGGSSQNKP